MNTIEPGFFLENIKAGYEARKIRHSDKMNSQFMIDTEIYALLKGSNQIVKNRGKALSYMNDKKRARDPEASKPKHEYDLKRTLNLLNPNHPNFNTPASRGALMRSGDSDKH